MSKLKKTNMRNVYLTCFVILVSVAGIIHTYIGGGWSASSGEAAKTYPRAVYAILILVSLFILCMELTGKVAFEPPAITDVRWWQVPVILAATIGFFEFALYIGVAVGLLLFLFGMIWLFDEDPVKHWKMNLLVAAIATMVLWAVFHYVLPIITRSQFLI